MGRYQLNVVTGDAYAGSWPKERFSAHAISYESSEKSKSEIYGHLLPLLNSKRIELLDDRWMLGQLLNLERRTARVRDVIDHGPGTHDDLINSIAGVAYEVSEGGISTPFFFAGHFRSPDLFRH